MPKIKPLPNKLSSQLTFKNATFSEKYDPVKFYYVKVANQDFESVLLTK